MPGKPTADSPDARRQAILAAVRAIPAARRNISVTQALREWMAHDYPCA